MDTKALHAKIRALTLENDFDFYNRRRLHNALDHRAPNQAYSTALPLPRAA